MKTIAFSLYLFFFTSLIAGEVGGGGGPRGLTITPDDQIIKFNSFIKIKDNLNNAFTEAKRIITTPLTNQISLAAIKKSAIDEIYSTDGKKFNLSPATVLNLDKIDTIYMKNGDFITSEDLKDIFSKTEPLPLNINISKIMLLKNIH